MLELKSRSIEQGADLASGVKLDWEPLPKQKMALATPAFETLFGGSAGGGKSDLLVAVARLYHRRSVLFRRAFPDLERSLIQRSLELYGDRNRYNAGKHVWTFPEVGQRIEFAHLKEESSVYSHQSAQYDLIGFDEVTQFSKFPYVYMLSRARTTVKGQRVRIIACTNPGNEGNDWVMERWAPWLDEGYPDPAQPGELRWFKQDKEGKDVECEASDPEALSRTFIPARLADNPYLPDEYRRQLNSLPEPWRSQLRDGKWSSGLYDDPYQLVPTEWIRLAQRRWTPEQPGLLSTVGVDPARGGCFDDQTEILTNDGWKLFENLRGNEQVLTLNGEIAEWGPIQQIHKYAFDGMLNLYDGKRLNFCITDNHKLPIITQTGKRYLRRYDECPESFQIKRTNTWAGTSPTQISFEFKRDQPHGGSMTRTWTFDMLDWAAFVGWFLSEGSVYHERRQHGRWRINVAQRPGDKLNSLLNLLTRMNIRFRMSASKHAGGIEFTNAVIGPHLIECCCARGAHNKRVPEYIKNGSPDVMRAFLETFRMGDGTFSGSGTPNYSTTSKGLADDLQEMLVKLGCAGKIAIAQTAGSTALIGDRLLIRHHTVYVVNQRTKICDSDVVKKKVERVPYSGYVYCVTTPYHTIMVRRKGCAMWSGNSDATVIAPRSANWIGPLSKTPGKLTPTGYSVVQLMLPVMRRGGIANLDVIGLGAAVEDAAREAKLPVSAINVSSPTPKRDRSGKIGFVNLRAYLYWKLREALDPEGDILLALPPDPELLGDLRATKWELTARGVKIIDKDEIRDRIGRSPNCADAVMLTMFQTEIIRGGVGMVF